MLQDIFMQSLLDKDSLNSVREAVKKHGLASSYTWLFSIESMRLSIFHYGLIQHFSGWDACQCWGNRIPHFFHDQYAFFFAAAFFYETGVTLTLTQIQDDIGRHRRTTTRTPPPFRGVPFLVAAIICFTVMPIYNLKYIRIRYGPCIHMPHPA